MTFIYLDYNATTPIDPRVAEAMGPFLTGAYGNPSSIHRAGREARQAIEQAREHIASCLGCEPREVILTSGGTESNNLAIGGVVAAAGGGHVITSAVEHPAVLEVVRALHREGRVEVSVVAVDNRGRVDPDDLVAELRDDTVLVSLMLANNEVGTLQPVAEVAAVCRSRGIPIHTDAAQAVGKIPVDVNELGVDLLTVAGHKLYAPKGVGALVVRDGIDVSPQMRGADHERGLRPGTENVLEVVGLGAACGLLRAEVEAEGRRLDGLRDRLIAALRSHPEELVVHGDPDSRLPNTLSVAFPGCDAGRMLERLADDVAASAGAACHAEGVSVSHVLAAMGIDERTARGTLRLSVGRFTTEAEVERAAELILHSALD